MLSAPPVTHVVSRRFVPSAIIHHSAHHRAEYSTANRRLRITLCRRNRWMVVHRLDTNAPRSRKSIEEDLSSAREESRRYALCFQLHAHGWILVDPAARLHVDLLARLQRYLEHVAITVQPYDPVAVSRTERVDEQPRLAEENVADSVHTLEGEIDRVGCSQELMLAHVDRLSAREMQRNYLSRTIATERDVPHPLGLRHEDWHAGYEPLERAGERLHADGNRRMLP